MEKMSEEKRNKYATTTSIMGIIANVILCAFKITLGILSASISLVADGTNNLTDAVSSVTSLVGFKLSSQPADKEHPFGHERIEYITGIIISVIVLVVGILLGKSSLENIIDKNTIDVSNFTILVIVLVTSIMIKLVMGIIYKRVGKRIESMTVIATGQDSINDCITTFFVLVSIVIYKIWNLNLDAYFGLLVSIYIIIGGIKLVIDTSKPLIGEAPTNEEVKSLADKVLSYEGVLGIHDLIFHSYGHDLLYITMHVEVDSKDDVVKSHELIDRIEKDINSDGHTFLTIHMDPVEVNDELTNELKKVLKDVIVCYEKITFHDFRIIKGEKRINVIFDIVRPYDYKMTKEELKQDIINKFTIEAKKIKDVNYVLIIGVDDNYVL